MIPPDVIETHTGRYVKPLALCVSDVCIEDVAFALSNESRFGGHVRWCVADHCLLVAKIVRLWGYGAFIQLQAILHDGGEAYLRDLPSPIKYHPSMAFYLQASEHAQCMVFDTLVGVYVSDPVDQKTIKTADRVALALEAEEFLPSRGHEWSSLTEDILNEAHNLRNELLSDLWPSWRPAIVEHTFLSEYKKLKEEIQHVKALVG